MYPISKAREALAAVDLRQGLAVSEVHTRLQQGLRLQDTGQRILAFYLTEMEDRRLHQETGHSSTGLFAEARLGLDRRRTAELISVGRKLLTLPAIDSAFCGQRLGWSKVLHLVKVATPEHEDAWLERALALTCRELALEVRLSPAGGPPRKPGGGKGLPEVRFRVTASVGVLTHQKLDLAKQKLSAELGRPVDDAECLDVLAELFLNMEEDGTVPGRTHVPASLYRILLRSDDGGGGGFLLDSDLGPLPIGGCETDDIVARVIDECVCCDGEHVHVSDHEDHKGNPKRDLAPKTSSALRRRVIVRDGGRCRCCGSRHRLMVHHIVYRLLGGRTCFSNLITLCVSCHALVHAELMILEGDHADRVRFLDAQGRPLHEPGERVALAALLPLSEPERDANDAAPVGPSPAPVALDTVPDVVDGAWWRRHAPLIRFSRERGLELREGRPLPAQDEREASEAVPFEQAFAGIVGQDALLERLGNTAKGSRARGRSFPHTLLVGPPGTGKTTLARGVAACFGSRLLGASGPLLQDAHILVRLLSELCEGDMLFVDEVHAVPRAVLETLYEALAEGHLTLTLHSGMRTRVVRLDLPAFTLLAATTEDGDLPTALRSRFGLREELGFYALEDLAELLTHSARAQGSDLDAAAAARLAACARGTPREALRLLDRVLDQAAARRQSDIDGATADAALERMGYDRDGLVPAEQRYLALLRQSPVPIPLGRLACMLGSSVRTLLQHLEPFLFRRGLVRMTARGRTAVHSPRLLEA